MVIGNPYEFAFIIDMVSEWNIEGNRFRQGIFFISVQGNLFPPVLDTTTLSTDIYHLLEDPSAFLTLPENEALFKNDRTSAFKEMFELASPGSFDSNVDFDDPNLQNNYTFVASNTTMEDNGSYMFTVSDKESVRILAANVIAGNEDLLEITGDVSEIILSKRKMQDYVSKLKDFYNCSVVNP